MKAQALLSLDAGVLDLFALKGLRQRLGSWHPSWAVWVFGVAKKKNSVRVSRDSNRPDQTSQRSAPRTTHHAQRTILHDGFSGHCQTGPYPRRVPTAAAPMIIAAASATLHVKLRPVTSISNTVEASGVM